MTSRERAEHERQVTEFLRTQGVLRSPDENEVRDRRIARIESEHFDEQDGRELLNEGFRVVRSDLDPRSEFDFDEDERAEIERLAREKAMAMVCAILPAILRHILSAKSFRARIVRGWAWLLHLHAATASEAAKDAGVKRQAVEKAEKLCEEEMFRIRRRMAA